MGTGVQVVPGYLGNFGAFQVPGQMEGLGRDLAALGQGVAGVIDPHIQFHERLRDALAANPELMERFADFAANSPDAWEQMSRSRLIPRDVLEQVSRTNPTAAGALNAAVRPQIQALAGKKESELPAEPTGAQIAAWGRLTGERPKSQLQREQEADALTFYHGIPPEERKHMAAEGQIPGLKLQEEMAFRQKLFDERDKDRIKNRVDELRMRSAQNMADRTGVSTAEDWDDYLHNSKRMQRAKDMVAGTIPAVSQRDSLDMEMQHAYTLPLEQRKENLSRAEAAHRALEYRTLDGLIEHINGSKRYAPDDEDMGKARTDLLQEQLDQIFGPGAYKASYGQKRYLGIFGHGNNLQITDKTGNPVDPEMLTGHPADMSQVNPQMINMRLGQNPRAQAIWQGILKGGSIEDGLRALHEKEQAARVPDANSIWMEIMNAARTR